MNSVEIIKGLNGYGLKDKVVNSLIIECNYPKEMLEDIFYVLEIVPGLYLCFKSSHGEIVGFYDKSRDKLIKTINNSYTIYKNVLLLKNEVLTTKGSTFQEKINSRIYISFYDFEFGNYVTSFKMYGVSGERMELKTYGGDVFRKFYDSGIEIKNDILFFKTANAFYDLKVGKLYQNYKFYNPKEGNFFLRNLRDNEIEFGEYDIHKRQIVKYLETPIRDLYQLDNSSKYSYFDSYTEKIMPVLEYSDFYTFNKTYEFVLFSKDFKVIKRYDKFISNITEFTYQEALKLGINKSQESPTYLINGKLYEYTNKNYPFSSNTDYPFTEISGKIISYYDYQYGSVVIQADSQIEFDYLLESLDNQKEEMEKRLFSIYQSNQSLQDSYPKLIKKK